MGARYGDGVYGSGLYSYGTQDFVGILDTSVTMEGALGRIRPFQSTLDVLTSFEGDLSVAGSVDFSGVLEVSVYFVPSTLNATFSFGGTLDAVVQLEGLLNATFSFGGSFDTLTQLEGSLTTRSQWVPDGPGTGVWTPAPPTGGTWNPITENDYQGVSAWPIQ